ncbi:TPA: biogenesis of lysosome-related organelles complex 1 subunit 1 [Trebouxia sp. C0004]
MPPDPGLQEACTKQPKLRRNAAVLARDIAAVCMGLRAAIMVDYMPLSSSTMLAILADVQAQFVDSKQWDILAVLHLDGCLYLLRHDACCCQIAKLSSAEVKTVFVDVHTDPCGQPFLGVASDEAVKAVAAELETMCNLIIAAEPSNKGACTFVDLDTAVGIPIMPTLSGWLLQYPIVYLAHRATAETLAQLLSDTVLVFHEVQLDGPFIKVLEEQFTWHDKLRSLCAFTVPEDLSLKCNVALKSWQACMMNQWQRSAKNCPLSQCNIVSQRLSPHQVQL